MTALVHPSAELVDCAQHLVDAVELDNNGMMVAGRWVGGNGGLYSPATIAAADQLRKALYAHHHDGAPPDDHAAAAVLRDMASKEPL